MNNTHQPNTTTFVDWKGAHQTAKVLESVASLRPGESLESATGFPIAMCGRNVMLAHYDNAVTYVAYGREEPQAAIETFR